MCVKYKRLQNLQEIHRDMYCSNLQTNSRLKPITQDWTHYHHYNKMYRLANYIDNFISYIL